MNANAVWFSRLVYLLSFLWEMLKPRVSHEALLLLHNRLGQSVGARVHTQIPVSRRSSTTSSKCGGSNAMAMTIKQQLLQLSQKKWHLTPAYLLLRRDSGSSRLNELHYNFLGPFCHMLLLLHHRQETSPASHHRPRRRRACKKTTRLPRSDVRWRCDGTTRFIYGHYNSHWREDI